MTTSQPDEPNHQPPKGNPLLGAIIGDFVGAPFEKHNTSRTDFLLFSDHSRFTDDTVLTVATAEALITDSDFAGAYQRWWRRYPVLAYGPGFRRWVGRGPNAPPYWSWGNGAAMRVGPVSWAFDDLPTVLEVARRSAAVTHNHPEGIQGAQAIAGAVFMLRRGAPLSEVRALVADDLGLPLHRELAHWRQKHGFTAAANQTVPVAFAALFVASGFEEAIRLAISAGGDSDTIAAMTGALAAARWGVPDNLSKEVWPKLPPCMREVLTKFNEHFGLG